MWTVLPGSIASFTNEIRPSAVASGMRRCGFFRSQAHLLAQRWQSASFVPYVGPLLQRSKAPAPPVLGLGCHAINKGVRIKTVICLVAVVILIGDRSLTHAQSQFQMTEQACGEFKKADAELNRVYQINKYSQQRPETPCSRRRLGRLKGRGLRSAMLTSKPSIPTPFREWHTVA